MLLLLVLAASVYTLCRVNQDRHLMPRWIRHSWLYRLVPSRKNLRDLGVWLFWGFANLCMSFMGMGADPNDVQQRPPPPSHDQPSPGTANRAMMEEEARRARLERERRQNALFRGQDSEGASPSHLPLEHYSSSPVRRGRTRCRLLLQIGMSAAHSRSEAANQRWLSSSLWERWP